MKIKEWIPLQRECAAVRIPSGEPIVLPAGAAVCITQSLGGTYTIQTDMGELVRIAGNDADALGQEVPSLAPDETAPTGYRPEEIEPMVWEQLQTCFDPEIPVNIVDLGLVYHCQVVPLAEGKNRVEVKFTLTAPGCGMGEVLKVDIEDKIRGLPHVAEVEVAVVFEPPWSQNMMSEAAQLELGLL